MVNLTAPEEQPARVGGEGSRDRLSVSRSHRNWRATYSRRRREDLSLRSEPTGLLQLEKLAVQTVKLMEKYSPKSKHNYEHAMDLLRLQYNLNFIVLCEKCHGPHVYDEIIAPER